MCPPVGPTGTQAENALEGMLAMQPVPLEADFPAISGFTVPPLEPRAAETIKIDRTTIRRGGYAEVYQGTWVAPGNTELET
ncbi:hypothetical protein FRC00_010139, partial [Tulasnella sp. 408]